MDKQAILGFVFRSLPGMLISLFIFGLCHYCSAKRPNTAKCTILTFMSVCVIGFLNAWFNNSR